MEAAMRSEEEMMHLILQVAKDDERVRAVYLNGSRTNPNAPKDRFQDYDVVYVVTDTKPYYEKHDWINHFGTVLYMQMPEYMDLLLEKEYTPQDTFGWLAIFTDGNRLDIHVSSFDYADKDIRADRLCRVLLDKDGRYSDIPEETDADHYVKKPTADKYSCECNEFYWCLNNIGKGLARGELTYAMDMLYDVVRPCLSVMLGWKIGAENDWSVSVGKSDKYMNRYLTPEIWHRYLETVPSCEYETIKRATETMIDLFEETAKEVAEYLSDAADAIRNNKVTVNGSAAKPSREVKVGDVIAVRKMQVTYSYRVLDLVSSRQPAKNVPLYCLNITPQEELDKLSIPRETIFVFRDRGTGRPTKKERRELDGLMDGIYYDGDE